MFQQKNCHQITFTIFILRHLHAIRLISKYYITDYSFGGRRHGGMGSSGGFRLGSIGSSGGFKHSGGYRHGFGYHWG